MNWSHEYGVKTLIRVGTCGALQPDLEIGDLILPMTSSTNSQVNRLRFDGMDYAPAADFDLLLRAYETARQSNASSGPRGRHLLLGHLLRRRSRTGGRNGPRSGPWLCEMETTALYTLAAKFGARALSVLTVSDNLVTGLEASAEKREQGISRSWRKSPCPLFHNSLLSPNQITRDNL